MQCNVEEGTRVVKSLEADGVVGDNLWLWRADHTVSGLVKDGDNPCETGLVVHGDDVTMYGLAVEHTLKDIYFAENHIHKSLPKVIEKASNASRVTIG